MLGSLYAKLIAAGAVIALLAGGLLWLGAHERGIGAAGVQAKWDAAAATAKAASATQTLDWTKQFSAIGAQYEAASHVQAPSIADTVAADVRAGTLQLRDEPVQSCAGSVSAATARSRAADAAATAALAQRVADSIAAVQVGDAADKREADFRKLIEAQRALLTAERKRQ